MRFDVGVTGTDSTIDVKDIPLKIFSHGPKNDLPRIFLP
jgi:hypothetical protein